MTSHELFLPHPSFAEDKIQAVAAASLGRFKSLSRQHTESDLKIFLRWSAEHQLQPMAGRRADVERYVRWLQETRRFKPSTVSRRTSVVCGFYRTCTIDGVLEHPPAWGYLPLRGRTCGGPLFRRSPRRWV